MVLHLLKCDNGYKFEVEDDDDVFFGERGERMKRNWQIAR